LSNFEKSYSKNDLTISIFSKITILQYFTIAIIALFVNFNSKNTIANRIGLLVGQYDDFTVGWYKDIGA
jgi:hypothetical protein